MPRSSRSEPPASHLYAADAYDPAAEGREPEPYDLVVLGAGSAGFAAARVASEEFGARVALIDRGPWGGLCILGGCMPSKTLIRSGEVAHTVERAAAFGIEVAGQRVDYARVHARMRGLIAEFAASRRAQIEGLPHTTRIEGAARFLDAHTVAVGERRLTARKFVLALGSTPRVPPLPGLAETGFWLSHDALASPRLPRSLAILGGGVIALELGQCFARLGVEVTILEASERILSREDPEVGAVLHAVLESEGLRILVGARALSVGRHGGLKRLSYRVADGPIHTLEAEELLVAVGREPAVAGLDLEAAGIRYAERRLALTRCLETTNPDVFAAGDVTGGSYLVHVAVADGELAARNALAGCPPRPRPERLLLQAAFTEPNVARVGLSEREARQQGLAVLVGRYAFADHGKALALGETAGLVQLIADAREGQIVGATVVGPQGAELIHELAVVIAQRLTVEAFLQVPHVHPTLAEIWTFPAEAILAQLRTGPRLRSSFLPAGYNDCDEEAPLAVPANPAVKPQGSPDGSS